MKNAAVYDWATTQVLWRRDLIRFWRQPSRLIGAMGQPIIFWFVIGSGMASTFAVAGSSIDYMTYFFPGVVLLIALFASIFASVSVIEDRHQGFLQAVLAGPGSRAALVVGKCCGSASVGMLQALLFLACAPLSGFSYASIDWPLVLLALLSACAGLSALGFAAAWALDNVQAYHAVQMTLLMPLWVVSGAMFPMPADQVVFRWAMRLNPIAYALSALRHGLHGGYIIDAGLTVAAPWPSLAVVLAFTLLASVLSVWVCRRKS